MVATRKLYNIGGKMRLPCSSLPLQLYNKGNGNQVQDLQVHDMTLPVQSCGYIYHSVLYTTTMAADYVCIMGICCFISLWWHSCIWRGISSLDSYLVYCAGLHHCSDKTCPVHIAGNRTFSSALKCALLHHGLWTFSKVLTDQGTQSWLK